MRMRPAIDGRPLTPDEFVAGTPEKLELVDGGIPDGEQLLLLLLTQMGLRRAAHLVGHERWRAALVVSQWTTGGGGASDVDPASSDSANESPSRSPEERLIANLRARREHLQQALEEASDHWGFEDPIYRFYHQSFKVYALQTHTEAIVGELAGLLPSPLNPWFLEILGRGTGRTFEPSHNRNWTEITRPILEAFFHARFFLEMAVRYAHLDAPPNPLPSGYAALLRLYGLRS